MMLLRTRLASSLAIAVVLLALVALPAAAFAANKPTYPSPYPWSRVPGGTTGDYFTDEYNGVSTGHVFESVNTDRLLDILSTNGTWYVALTGPEHASGQKVLGLLNTEAKAEGVSKIYTWDPFLDGYQLNSVDASGWGSMLGGSSVNSSGSVTVSEPWRLIKSLLPSSTVQPGGALYGYDGRGTLLLTVKVTDRTNLQTGKQVLASFSLEDTDAPTFDPGSVSAKSAIDAYLAPASNGSVVATSSVRSQYEFFKRIYNAAAAVVETQQGTTQTADRYGHAVDIFRDADYPSGAGFRLQEISIQEYFDLVQAPGEKVFFFASAGCHNTQAIIGQVAAQAKKLGTPVVYVVDLTLSSNVHFLTGANIDRADKVNPTGSLWVRSSATGAPVSGNAYPRYGYGYIYGAMASFLDPGFQTELTSKNSSSISYYPNGDFSARETSGGPWVAGNTNPNAKQVQVPFLFRYDKDAADPVIQHWLHTSSSSTATHTVYVEYMCELSWVNATPQSLLATGVPNGDTDGLTRSQFAREAVAALPPVLSPKTLANAGVTVSAEYSWTGGQIRPVPYVAFYGHALTLGTDYTVSYGKNTAVGVGAVTVTGIGSYFGSQKITFSIVPPAPTITSLSAGSGRITLAWSKVKGVAGYQVDYRRKGTVAWKTRAVSASKLSATLSGLENERTYQVRVRAYRKVGGVKYFSAYSAIKLSSAVN